VAVEILLEHAVKNYMSLAISMGVCRQLLESKNFRILRTLLKY